MATSVTPASQPVVMANMPGAAAPASTQPAMASQSNPTTYDAAPAASGGGLGSVASYVGDSLVGLASSISQRMNSLQTTVAGMYRSENGQPDMAAIMQVNSQMSMLEMAMEQISEMNKNRDRAARAAINMGN